MAQLKALLDTDILSAVMRGNPAVTARARAYLAEHAAFAFSIITRTRSYEASRPRTRPLSSRPAIAFARPATFSRSPTRS